MMNGIQDCISIADFESLAKKITPESTLSFVNSGATDEQTLEENCTSFKKWRFAPKCLTDVSNVDMKTKVLGQQINFPVGIAPAGLMKKCSDGGEVDAAQAAADLGTVFTLSTWASSCIEDIPTEGLRWFQLYMAYDRNTTLNLVKRAEENGYKAIVLTVDCQAIGKRYKIAKNFTFPIEMATKNFAGIVDHETLVKNFRHSAVTWQDFDWLNSITSLPIIVKGVLTAKAAIECLNHGSAGIWVSNHGGRQLDGALPSIIALHQVAKAIRGRCEIYFDGGIRNGGDVAKAIALGADAVFTARPIFWGLTCGGTDGAKRILEILRDEFESTMKLLGVRTIQELKTETGLVIHESSVTAKL